METKPLTQSQVNAARRMSGIGAMIFDWDIDLEVGQGVIGDGLERCCWNKKGKRITVTPIQGMGGGYIVSESKEPDPEYFELKEKAEQHG